MANRAELGRLRSGFGAAALLPTLLVVIGTRAFGIRAFNDFAFDR